MYFLEPISKERIWGTNRLHDYSGDNKIDKIGSVYSASGISEINCKVKYEKDSVTLSEIINEKPEMFGLKQGEVYPLIISFTACDENLSIQVHPTDEYAQQVEKKLYGKSEAWYFITPPENGWIYAEQVITDKKELKQAIEKHNYEKILKEYPVLAKELVYIPSGTIHALTKGSLVYEIQQATDITYRFYDYDRVDSNGEKRNLHVNKALATLIPEQKVEKESFPFNKKIEKREFTIQQLKLKGSIQNTADIASILTIISGEIFIEEKRLSVGESVLLLPKEKISFSGEAQGILAIPQIYWRKA